MCFANKLCEAHSQLWESTVFPRFPGKPQEEPKTCVSFIHGVESKVGKLRYASRHIQEMHKGKAKGLNLSLIIQEMHSYVLKKFTQYK